MVYNASKTVFRLLGGRPLITFAPRGRVGGQVSYTFPLRITC